MNDPVLAGLTVPVLSLKVFVPVYPVTVFSYWSFAVIVMPNAVFTVWLLIVPNTKWSSAPAFIVSSWLPSVHPPSGLSAAVSAGVPATVSL